MSTPEFEKSDMFKIEVEDGQGLWSDVRGDDGNVLTFESEDATRAALAARFPVLVQMKKYAGGKRTRVIRASTTPELMASWELLRLALSSSRDQPYVVLSTKFVA